MKVIYLYGAPAIGKRTIAYELAKKKGFKVVDNHIHTPLVLKFFPQKNKWYWELRKEIRQAIFNIAIKAKLSGLILTGVYEAEDFAEIKKLVQYFKKKGVKVEFVHLTCSEEERKKRVVPEGRKDKLLRSLEKLRPNKMFAKIKGINHPTLDITNMSARDAALNVLKILK